MSSRHKNLIIVRAGPSSLHANWLEGAGPVFDVLVAAYHPAAMANDTERSAQILPRRQGGGVERGVERSSGIARSVRANRIHRRRRRGDAATINQCFKVGERYGLQIWQPALSADSYITYAASLQNPHFELRFCNYVEMMCPFFHTKPLKKVAPLFSLGFESGIDLIWCSIANENGGACAVVDGCIVRHTRPVGRAKDSTASSIADTKPISTPAWIGSACAGRRGSSPERFPATTNSSDRTFCCPVGGVAAVDRAGGAAGNPPLPDQGGARLPQASGDAPAIFRRRRHDAAGS